MKCREKNIEKTFLKVENNETFWEELKRMNVKVVLISEKGVAVTDYFCKYFAEFGEYIIVSNDGIIEICGENEFNRRYEVIDGDKNDISSEELMKMKGYVDNFATEVKKFLNVIPKINVSFGDLGKTEKFDEIMKKLSEIFKI